MIIKGHDVNTNLTRIVKSIAKNLQNNNKFLGEKLDEASHVLELPRPISPNDTQYIYDNATYVSVCSQILAEDTILNDIVLTPNTTDEDDVLKETVAQIQDNLLSNIDELYNMAVDYNYSGFGALEIDYSDGSQFTLKQLPSNTCAVIQITEGQEKYYLLRQRINTDTFYYRILGEDYTNFVNKEQRELSDVILMGGDNFYLFYSKPRYMSILKKIFTQIAIESKNYNKMSKGNIANGVLHFNLPPQFGVDQYDEFGDKIYTPTREELISEELSQADSGIAVIFTESQNPISMDYVNIESGNDSYLEAQQKNCEESVLNCYRIPLARLMINTEKESMNSNKTQSIWEIYTLSLKQEQKKWQQLIKELIYALYSIDVVVTMGTPDFSDNRETEVNLIIQAWDSGALTLEQLITGLSEYINIINLEDYDFSVNTDLWQYRKVEMGDMSIASDEELKQIESVMNAIQ